MSSSASDFIKKLNQGPAVLFLGQNYLKMESGEDPFLKEVIRKYKIEEAAPCGYSLLIDVFPPQQYESTLAWMSGRSEKISSPEWLKVVSNFAWNCVYTSAIDIVWYRAFTQEWRSLFPIFEEKYKPMDVRSRMLLHSTFLFGCINRPADEKNERPPFSSRELRNRKQKAVILSSRIPDIVTPFGVLVVEGYDGENDWFGLDQGLLPIIDALGKGQVHIFSAGKKLTANPEIINYMNEGKVVLYSENLAYYLAKHQDLIGPDRYLEDVDIEHRFLVGEKVFGVPIELYNVVSRSANILDDSILLPQKEFSGEHYRYYWFRNFLAESSVKPIWSGYGQGFAFQRDYEKELLDEVNRQILSRSLHNEPIILHGPSGTGKTVALGALAYELRKKNRCPVLFIERKPQRPVLADIDAFCKWAEDEGASFTLVIWDGMIDVDQYSELLHYLAKRGRKVILVGSCYKSKRIKGNKRNLIEAPPRLAESEVARFKNFLMKIDPDLNKLVSRRIEDLDFYFLVMLYRLLPSTQSNIRKNLNEEVIAAERRATGLSGDELVDPSSMAFLLLQAGFLRKDEISLDQTKTVDGEDISTFSEIIGLIMVPGRFGIRVPIDLVLRASNRTWISNLFKHLDEDIFNWEEDEKSGQILIGPRHPLEAQLIVQSRLGMPDSEVHYARKLIMEVSGSMMGDNTEISFAVELLRSIGPNGENANYFASNFLNIANILKDLREQRSIEHPRLMLQEAFLLREWVERMYFDQVNLSAEALNDAMGLLERASKILQRAINLIADDNRSARLKSTILVEIGANLAARTNFFDDETSDEKILLDIYDASKQNLYQAFAISPDDFHPFDVLHWMSRNLLSRRTLEEYKRAEITAELLNAFSMIEPDELDFIQRERYFGKRQDLGRLLSDAKMSEEAFEALKAIGSKAGYYIKAYTIAGKIPVDRELLDAEKQSLYQAAKYLQQNRVEISEDGRCLNLLLRCLWMSKTGKPIHFGERETLPFSNSEWRNLVQVIQDLINVDSYRSTLLLNYLLGIATFHIGQVNSSLQIFRELEREAENIQFRKRIIRSYIASNQDGKPIVYHGTVDRIFEDHSRGFIYVEELRSRIMFIPLDFLRGRELEKNDPIGPFHIAFNFIGPVADPTSKYSQGKAG